jgi:hypothetical protein
MSEQLGLQQRFRDGAAIDGDDGFGSPLAVTVQCRNHQLLTGPGLSLDQDREVGGGDRLHLVDDVTDRRAGTHLSVETAGIAHLATELLNLVCQAASLQESAPTRGSSRAGRRGPRGSR